MFYRCGHIITVFLILVVFSSLFSQEKGDSGLEKYSVLTVDNTIIYYQDSERNFAHDCLNWSMSFNSRLNFLSTNRPGRLIIIIAPSETEFFRISGGRLPEWGVACAFPEKDIILLRSPRLIPLWKENPRSILIHEISHVFLDQQLRPAKIPLWFHEGFATWVADIWGVGNGMSLSLAMVFDRMFSFEELSNHFPVNGDRARLAYQQSFTVINYLFSSRSDEQLRLLFDSWRENGDLDTAMRARFGITLHRFEERWKQWAHARYGWFRFLTGTSVIWLGAALLFLFVFVSRRTMYYRRLEELKRQEAEESASEQIFEGWKTDVSIYEPEKNINDA